MLAVVRPRSLLEQWRVIRACIGSNAIIIMQAANTGLTGGSTPAGGYDRDVVIVNTMLIDRIYLINQGQQVVCLPGATLNQLEQALEPLGREPHSIIGSSCIGASVIGGVCNNSGGALVRRGPAYTQMSLFARRDATGRLELVNHLDIRLGEGPAEILGRLDRGEFGQEEVLNEPSRHASDQDYSRQVREIDSDSPARFNADPQRLFEASGSAGRIALFAVRLDTFPKERRTKVFYIGTRDPAEFTQLRRNILGRFKHLPVAAEYMHRGMFDIAAEYGKDTFLLRERFGTKRLPRIFRLKHAYDYFMTRFGLSWVSSDKLLQALSRVTPSHLPDRMNDFRHRFEHHLILKVSEPGFEEIQDYLSSAFPSRTGAFFECTDTEARKAFLHRFVAAGAAIRFAAVHREEVEGIVALDIALRRNDRQWLEVLPNELHANISLALYYGHFLCHVFHQDYVVRKGCSTSEVKEHLLRLLDERGAKYPAEHNVGHQYTAEPELTEFYRKLDPCNSFNPGIGQSSKLAGWADQRGQ